MQGGATMSDLAPEPGCECPNCKAARLERKVDLILKLVRKMAAKLAIAEVDK